MLTHRNNGTAGGQTKTHPPEEGEEWGGGPGGEGRGIIKHFKKAQSLQSGDH